MINAGFKLIEKIAFEIQHLFVKLHPN